MRKAIHHLHYSKQQTTNKEKSLQEESNIQREDRVHYRQMKELLGDNDRNTEIHKYKQAHLQQQASRSKAPTKHESMTATDDTANDYYYYYYSGNTSSNVFVNTPN